MQIKPAYDCGQNAMCLDRTVLIPYEKYDGHSPLQEIQPFSSLWEIEQFSSLREMSWSFILMKDMTIIIP